MGVKSENHSYECRAAEKSAALFVLVQKLPNVPNWNVASPMWNGLMPASTVKK